MRVLFAFDPDRQAVLLVAGDKAGRWRDWYRINIPIAESRYDEWLRGERAEETGDAAELEGRAGGCRQRRPGERDACRARTEALGGKLRIVAEFDDESIALN